MKSIDLAPAAILVAALAFAPATLAQETAAESATDARSAEQVLGPVDALNRGTPRGSITGFLEAASNFDFDKAAEYLDLRQLPDEADQHGGPELARQFNHVVGKKLDWVKCCRIVGVHD